jgi:hypothetical protein
MSIKSHISCAIAAAVAPILAQAGIKRTDGSLELIDSSDVSLFQMSSIIAAPIADWELDVSLSASDFTFDYKPVNFDFNESDITRDEQNYALQLNGRKLLNEQTTLLLGAGTYDAFSRSTDSRFARNRFSKTVQRAPLLSSRIKNPTYPKKRPPGRNRGALIETKLTL